MATVTYELSKSIREICLRCASADCVYSFNCASSIYIYPYGESCSFQVWQAFKYYCQNHTLERLNLAEVAENVGLHIRQLRNRIKKETGRTPKECFMRIQFEHVLKLASEFPDLPITKLVKAINWTRQSFWRASRRFISLSKKRYLNGIYLRNYDFSNNLRIFQKFFPEKKQKIAYFETF